MMFVMIGISLSAGSWTRTLELVFSLSLESTSLELRRFLTRVLPGAWNLWYLVTDFIEGKYIPHLLHYLVYCIPEYFFLIEIHSMQGWTANTRHGVTRKRKTERLQHTGNLFRKNLQLEMSINSRLKATKIIGQRKPFYRQRIPESSCSRKETVNIEVLVTSRNGDRKIMLAIRITSRPPSSKRKWNQSSQLWRTLTKLIPIEKT